MADRLAHEPVFLAGRAGPPDDPAREGVDGERGVYERSVGHADVGEVRDEQHVGGGYPELAFDQIGCPRRGRISDRGANLFAAGNPTPAVGPHEPFHGATRHGDALTLQVSPHLGGAVQRLRFAAAVLVRLVEAGQHFGDHGVPEGPR